MRNDISPEELQRKLDEIYYANTSSRNYNNQNNNSNINNAAKINPKPIPRPASKSKL